MPVDTQLTVKASEVRKGDLVSGLPVTNLVRKAKYTYIYRDVGVGKPLTVRHDQTIDVVRSVQTPDERRAEETEWVIESAEKAIEAAHKRVQETAQKLVEYSAYRIDMQWSPLATHMEALAVRDLWAAVAIDVGKTYGELSDKAGQTVTLLESIAETAQETRRNVLSNRWRGGSTSSTSNLADDTMRAVACRWLDDWTVRFAVKLVNGD